ncbi:MAG: hypothetical protein ACKV19_27550 [Verrucomicrobiales bacterium]
MAHAEGTPRAKAGMAFYLKVDGPRQEKFLSQNSNDYATVGTSKAGYVIGGGGGDLTNGSDHKITLGGKWLYETAKGNAGFYDSDTGDAATWKIHKQKGECDIKDDEIRHGDVVQFSNGYWTDNYLCDYENGYAAAGTYNKPRNWKTTFDYDTLKVSKGQEVSMNDEIDDVVYIKNLGGESNAAAEVELSLSTSDEIGVAKSRTDEWQAVVDGWGQGGIHRRQSLRGSLGRVRSNLQRRANASQGHHDGKDLQAELSQAGQCGVPHHRHAVSALQHARTGLRRCADSDAQLPWPSRAGAA